MTQTFSQFRENMLQALYQAQVHDGEDDILPFAKLANEYGLDWKTGWLDELQRGLRDEGLLRGPSNGVGDEMAYGKLSGSGLRYIEDKYGTLKGVPTMISKPEHDDLLVATDDPVAEDETEDAPVATNGAFSAESWTGSRLVLTDEKVLRLVRSQAAELRDRIYGTRFESNSDSQDLKSLSDALVAVCDMAEPDLSILDRILRHPKFQISAALIAAVATIRGAIGF